MQLDVEHFESLLLQWMAAQPGVSESNDTLVCNGKTLRGSIAKNASGAKRSIDQVRLYFNSLGVAIGQGTYATDDAGEVSGLRELLARWSSRGCWSRPTRCMKTTLFHLFRAAWRGLPKHG